ncbi:hypothetical protein [Halalkalirubrum salinum]|uniref:hypothetical protein n=1 Tax=Halalkalirubrum salinum TaxID=2563889 RepID=UPI0010FB633A|nr:hypothetical protein [Halalkalirubrum salinum]
MSREDGTAKTVAVIATAPEGVQKYTAHISVDAGGSIAAVDAGALERFFEVVEGGSGSAFARVRAVDMTGEARNLEGEDPLFSVTFDEPVAAESISLRFETLVGHDGETIPTESVRFEVVD